MDDDCRVILTFGVSNNVTRGQYITVWRNYKAATLAYAARVDANGSVGHARAYLLVGQ